MAALQFGAFSWKTSQVLNDTLGRLRGPRDVSAGGRTVADGKAGYGQAETILAEGALTFLSRRCGLLAESGE